MDMTRAEAIRRILGKCSQADNEYGSDDIDDDEVLKVLGVTQSEIDAAFD